MSHVVVIVLGDIGRSPRMQYHVQSLSQMDSISKVTLIGYGGEKLISSLENNPKVDTQALEINKVKVLQVKSSILRAILKGSYLLFWLFQLLLFKLSRYDAILIQNPPALPAFFVAIFASFFNGASIIIDWHNLGYSIYEHGLQSKSHPLVKITKFCEHQLCKFATHHVCVSKALKVYLANHCNIDAIVLYDRPPAIFQASEKTVASAPSAGSRVKFLTSLNIQNIVSPSIVSANNPALIVSGTSWTPDEDFSILLDSLVSLEAYLCEKHSEATAVVGHDALICVVTGKGDLRSTYEAKIQQLCAESKLGKYVSIHTSWLSIEDYPRLLASADLGISLHLSTSGLDLPMKVLDMFGSGLPVLALDFPTLHELVTENSNGLVFSSSSELSSHLITSLFMVEGKQKLQKWRQNLANFDRWDTNWTKHMLPVVQKAMKKVA